MTSFYYIISNFFFQDCIILVLAVLFSIYVSCTTDAVEPYKASRVVKCPVIRVLCSKCDNSEQENKNRPANSGACFANKYFLDFFFFVSVLIIGSFCF